MAPCPFASPCLIAATGMRAITRTPGVGGGDRRFDRRRRHTPVPFLPPLAFKGVMQSISSTPHWTAERGAPGGCPARRASPGIAPGPEEVGVRRTGHAHGLQHDPRTNKFAGSP
jgi:hypothetical protein